MEIIGIIILLVILGLLIRFRKQVLILTFFVVPMAVAFPSLLIAIFKTNIFWGLGAITASLIGWVIWSKTKNDYPSLDDDINNFLGIWGILLLIAAIVTGMVWGVKVDGALQTVIKLVILLYGGISLFFLFGPLSVIPLSISLRRHKSSMFRKLSVSSLDEASSLDDWAFNVGLKKPQWIKSNFYKIMVDAGTPLKSNTVAGEAKTLVDKTELAKFALLRIGSKKFVMSHYYQIIISFLGYDMLKRAVESYLLENGTRNLSRLESAVAQNAKKSRFLEPALDELVKSGIVETTNIGPPITQNEKGKIMVSGDGKGDLLYSHKLSSNNMETEELELSDDDL